MRTRSFSRVTPSPWLRVSFAPVVIAVVAAPGSLAGADVVEFAITLDGSQEVPPVDTPANGSGAATLNTDTNLFTWNITFSGLKGNQTAAHFHGAAPICVEAGIQIGLPLGSPIVGQDTLTAQQEADLLAGLWYVNVHTNLHAGGEIRGQVAPVPLDDPLPAVPIGSVHVKLEVVADGLTAPNWGASAPGITDRLYVTDQDGILWNINLTTGDKSVFLDVTGRIVALGIFGPGSFDERGLLGVAFHPGYANNGLLYTYTSEPNRGPADFSTMPKGATANHQTIILEWEVLDPSDPDSVVDPKSTRELLRIDQPQFNHDGGAVNFGPDGMLYISLGDGGAGDDQETGLDPFGEPNLGHGCRGNGANINTILGTVVRIDPQGNNAANGQYGIPDDNPFVGKDGVDEIFASGLRNPFRFSFDSMTGDLYLADVGQNDIEEIDLVVSGGDYGWNFKEGSFFFIPNGANGGYVTNMAQEVPDGLIDPIAQYDHDDGIAIIGGFVYRGIKMPVLEGRYVFGEFALLFDNDGRLFYLDENDDIQEFQLVDQDEVGRFVLGMGQDANGELYLMANSTGVPFDSTGVVLRIVPKTGDLDGDGIVGVPDLLVLLGSWGNMNSAADLDMDGIVGVKDLLILLGNWG